MKGLLNELNFFFSIGSLTFATGKIPDDLKVALITPVYKACEENIYSNYRPISALPCFYKIREKLMAFQVVFFKRLFEYIHKNGILTDCQYGFRTNVLTNHAKVNLLIKQQKPLKAMNSLSGYFLI